MANTYRAHGERKKDWKPSKQAEEAYRLKDKALSTEMIFAMNMEMALLKTDGHMNKETRWKLIEAASMVFHYGKIQGVRLKREMQRLQ